MERRLKESWERENKEEERNNELSQGFPELLNSNVKKLRITMPEVERGRYTPDMMD